MDMLDNKQIEKLLDYITNLQEYETIIEMEFKREYAKRYLEEKRKEEPHLLYPDSDEIYKRYYELKEENTKLKELCDKYEEEHNNAFKLWTMKMEEKQDYEERMNYKSRIKKIINKISLYRMDDITMETNRILDDLLNTARGVDKE